MVQHGTCFGSCARGSGKTYTMMGSESGAMVVWPLQFTEPDLDEGQSQQAERVIPEVLGQTRFRCPLAFGHVLPERPWS